MNIRRVFMPVAVAAALLPVLAKAQEKSPLPTGAQVLDDYVKATGGKAAYERLTNRVSVGTLEIQGASLKGKITLTQAAPAKLLNETDLGQAGKSTQATDGRLAWEISTFGGERLLKGEEEQSFKSQAIFNAEVRWREAYTDAKCLGIEDVDGKPAYKVELTRSVGKPVIEYYDVNTHLMTKHVSTTKTPGGEVKVEVFPTDYRKIDGILIPQKAKQVVLGQAIVMSFDEIKHNVELSDDRFAPPAAIKSLAKKKPK
jgi:hypothetical protein